MKIANSLMKIKGFLMKNLGSLIKKLNMNKKSPALSPTDASWLRGVGSPPPYGRPIILFSSFSLFVVSEIIFKGGGKMIHRPRKLFGF